MSSHIERMIRQLRAARRKGDWVAVTLLELRLRKALAS